jgi:hypothetical protein
MQYIAEGLSINQSLQWLGLGGNSIGPDGVRLLCDVRNSGRHHYNNAQGLASNQTLTWLGLGGNEIGDRATAYLAGLLKGMHLRYENISNALCFIFR